MVSTSLASSSIHDTWVSSVLPSDNRDSSVLLGVGYGTISQITRTYIKFDLPTLTAADLVTNARVYLSLYSDQPTIRQTNVHRVNSDWNSSTITWNNAPGFNPKVEDYVMVNGLARQSFNWDITGIVKDWYTTGNNYGLMLKHQDETTGYDEFVSADTSTAYQPYRAQVAISYVNNSGLESYWTYHSQDVGRAGTGFVNDYNGNVVFIHNDLAMNGNRMPVTLNHVYNSNDKDSTIGYGYGWRLNLSQRIVEQTIDGVLYYVYTDEDGTKHYYKYDLARGAIVDELNPTEYTLTKNADGTYVIKDKKNNQLTFTASGYLWIITDNNGNSMSLSYNGATLSTITDGAGRVTTLDINQYGYLIGIIDPSNRRTGFGYNGAQLTTITYPDGTMTSYTYDTSNKLTGASYNNGYKITYSYYSAAPYRVQKVLETHTNGTLGNELNISYGYNTTFFTDVKGRKTTYQFNNSGNTISVKDTDGNAEYYKYLSEANVNKLSLNSKLQKTVINLLKNHNIEQSGYWTEDYWSGSTGTLSFTTEDKYLGNQALKVNKTNTSSSHFYSQALTLEKGKTYTFSGYVKTNNISSFMNKGAALFVNYQDSAGNWQTVESKYVNGSTDYNRLELSFTLPANAYSTTVYARAGIIEETGIAYFDALQLEEGAIANRYNLVENASFEFDTGVPMFWANNAACDVNDTSVDVEKAFGTRSVRLNGVADKTKNFSQTINVSGQAGDVFVVSGWGKGSSVSLNNGSNRYFALDIGIHKTDGTYQWNVVTFNEDSTDWQYASDKVIASGPYTDITYYLLYYNEANTAYFDGLQLYKEEFGPSFTYDSNGNIVSSVDLAKQQSSFEYTNNDLTKAIDPKGNQFNYTYDSNHNVKTATSAENVLYSFTYDSYGNPLTAKVGDSTLFNQATATYTSNGNYLETLTDSEGNSVRYNFNQTKGTLDSVTDAKNQTTTYGYNPNNDFLTSASITADGQTVSNGYTYENDRLKSIKHNNEQVTYTFDYDSLGNNTSVKVGTQSLITNAYETYNSRNTGILQESTYGNGQKVGFDYDTLDRLIAKKYEGTVKFKYQYDGSGNLGYEEDLVNGISYRYVYDLADRLVKVNDSLGNSKAYGYDQNNNQTTFTEVIGGVAYATNYTYDKDNRLTEVNYSRPGQAGIKISFAYDPKVGRLTSKTITIGTVTRTTTYSYKEGSTPGSTTAKIASETINGKTITYAYDAGGNMTDITDGDGKIIHYDYNELNELKRENNQITNNTIVYTYDAGGNILKKEVYPYTTGTLGSPTSTLAYGYADANWKDKLTSYNGKAISYDAIGNPTAYDGWSFTWEAGRQLASMVQGTTNVSFQYNDQGIRTEKTVNGVTTKYYLNGDKVSLEKKGTDKIYYTYDAGGNLLSLNLNGASVDLYDPVNLTPVQLSGTNTAAEKFSATDLFDKVSVNTPSWANDIGNLTLSLYQWNTDYNTTVAATPIASKEFINFKDNAWLELTFPAQAAGEYLWVLNNPVETVGVWKYEGSTNSSTAFFNGAPVSGDYISRIGYKNNEYYYLRNAQNDVIGLMDSSGTQVVSYAYDSWGKLISTTGPLASTVGAKNPYLYRGYRYDSETGLYYLQSRYYNPEWGRFINADEYAGTLGDLLSSNVFSYTKNNPVNMSDPSGYNGSLAFQIGGSLLFGTEALLGLVSAPVVLIGIGVIGIGILAYEGYQYYQDRIYAETIDSGTIDSSGTTSSGSGGSGTGGPKPPKDHKHHVYPIALGGAIAQQLIRIDVKFHREIHAALYKFENGWLAPKRGYTGELIQRLYGAKKIQEGLMRFYNSNERFKIFIDPLKESIKFTGK